MQERTSNDGYLKLKRWKKIRQFQQQNRRYLLFHSTFMEFVHGVMRRRRRHGPNGDVQLLEEQINQSKLDDWMEYQDYELRTYKRLQKDFEEALVRLAFRRQALAEAGISALEGIRELEFANYYSLAIECGREEAKAKNKEKLAERHLSLAERRLCGKWLNKPLGSHWSTRRSSVHRHGLTIYKSWPTTPNAILSRSKTGLNQDIMSGAKDLKKDSDYSGLRSNLQSSRIKTKGMMSCKERVWGRVRVFLGRNRGGIRRRRIWRRANGWFWSNRRASRLG